MRLDKFQKLYHAGAVKRYHTVRVHNPQDLAAHSWGVAMIISAISEEPPSANLLMAALTHDLAESETGDIPAPVKWNNTTISNALDDLEFRFDKEHQIIFDLTDEELSLLTWADTFELVLYCGVELNMGNSFMRGTYNRGKIRLKQYGFPTTKASDLFFNLIEEGQE